MKMTIDIPEEYINYLGKRVMDEYEYRGFTIGEWADKILNDAPTADVEPVMHGRWIANSYTTVFPYKCSLCNLDTMARFNYCPNCGTRMDGGDNEVNV